MNNSPTTAAPRPTVHLARPPIPDTEKMMTTPLDLWIQTMEPYLNPTAQAAVRTRFGEWLGKPAHPALVSNEFSDFICQAGFPQLSMADARRRMARLSVAKYQESILGRVMLAPLRFMGFDRLLRQVPKQFAAATNYGTRWVAELGPRHWRFDCEDEIIHPEMTIGNLEAVAEMVGVLDLRMIYTNIAPRHYSYDIVWGGAS